MSGAVEVSRAQHEDAAGAPDLSEPIHQDLPVGARQVDVGAGGHVGERVAGHGRERQNRCHQMAPRQMRPPSSAKNIEQRLPSSEEKASGLLVAP